MLLSNNLNKEALIFLDLMFVKMLDLKIDLKNWSIDHICYRVNSQEAYDIKKQEFYKFSKLLIESPVNGRLISTFKLKKPIEYKGYVIDLIELPEPKLGKKTIEGFEHFEVVTGDTFDEIKLENKNCVFSEGGLAKSFNAELALKLGEYTIKFHQLSLESVVNFEKNKLVCNAVGNSLILENLKEFGPLVAGTYPLALETQGSDVDILVECNDFNYLNQLLIKIYGNISGFDSYIKEAEGEACYTAKFTFEDVDFEVFAQGKPAIKQRAYVHFQVEERLLKLAGDAFKGQLMALRGQGIKTEMAFSRLLKLPGDCFEAMSNLSLLSEQELKNLLLENQ